MSWFSSEIATDEEAGETLLKKSAATATTRTRRETLLDDFRSRKELFTLSFKRFYSTSVRQIAISILLTSAAWALIVSVLARQHSASDHAKTAIPFRCDCGGSVPEALALGCEFDSMSVAWLPPYCRDDELAAEFELAAPDGSGSWTFYANEDLTIPLSRRETAMLAGSENSTVWMTEHWHVVHCIYYWRKLYRLHSGETPGNIVEPYFNDATHIEHCGDVFLKRVPMEEEATRIQVRFIT